MFCSLFFDIVYQKNVKICSMPILILSFAFGNPFVLKMTSDFRNLLQQKVVSLTDPKPFPSKISDCAP